ncbi:Ion channel [Poriferisphaera corsica]|uniref:Ion channel n=1 Tax=Poriferisphaera corsica TaxID=2528020 RepID=A0A517YPN1_9BACT|nr:potassium channel family protein [Poriferisphaera corsica]QDU32179.1 Ion channel [Poriferisphaera corsica]
MWEALKTDVHAVWLFLSNLYMVFSHLYWLLILFMLCILMCGVLLSIFDQKSLGKSIYLAFITALTIGYGDVTPHTHRAKVVSIAVGLIGLVVTGVVVAAAIKAAESTIEEIEMRPLLEDMEQESEGYITERSSER